MNAVEAMARHAVPIEHFLSLADVETLLEEARPRTGDCRFPRDPNPAELRHQLEAVVFVALGAGRRRPAANAVQRAIQTAQEHAQGLLACLQPAHDDEAGLAAVAYLKGGLLRSLGIGTDSWTVADAIHRVKCTEQIADPLLSTLTTALGAFPTVAAQAMVLHRSDEADPARFPRYPPAARKWAQLLVIGAEAVFCDATGLESGNDSMNGPAARFVKGLFRVLKPHLPNKKYQLTAAAYRSMVRRKVRRTGR